MASQQGMTRIAQLERELFEDIAVISDAPNPLHD
jgi:hypothetical protein